MQPADRRCIRPAGARSRHRRRPLRSARSLPREDNWNLAALPSYQGKVTAPLNADTFRITKASKHPEQAFEFLRFLVQGDGKTKMLNAISGFPALKSDQASFFQQLEQQKDDKGKNIYPAGVNWPVVTDAIQFADVEKNSESFMPN